MPVTVPQLGASCAGTARARRRIQRCGSSKIAARPSGGIGRRRGLKILRRKACRFESDLGHIRFPRAFAKSGNFRGNTRFPGCQFSAISAHFGGFRANTEPTKSQRVTGAEMASVKKRGDVWGVRVSSGGRRESATFTTKREAEDWGRRRETELRREQDGTLGEVRTLRDALRRYAAEVAPTHKGERWETLRLGLLERDPVLPITLPLAKLTTAHLSAWKLERLKTVGPGSVLREISLLGSVLTAARREWHWMAHSPLADVVRPSQPAHRHARE